ncbi:MAG TPA: MBOAT family O-acyltransferase [Pseudomonadales bacterium]|nr:MBOAT family O-acyltransferase [Pseudomonadales bacterium]
MLFNSSIYIFLFLPVTVLVYFFLNGRGLHRASNIWLVVASVYFYGYWNPRYIPLITLSIAANFFLGKMLQQRPSKPLLAFAIVMNLGVLAYFKYASFILENLNALLNIHIVPIINNFFHSQLDLSNITLPLAISFFTFLQIAYLVDCYQSRVKETSFLHYALFVTYFPHLIAGPLVHHQELMPEFAREDNKKVNWSNIYLGLYIFSMGLFKKVFIADTFAEWANTGFNATGALSFFDAWGASLSYTMQLYFDFSGYSDMAIGASMLFNIKLPINFNSPYKALDIQDFWRRWHMTLSRWLREYLYIPLGGNRNGSFFTGINLCITFLLGGLWHGASWNFVIWGALHGSAVVVHRIWHATGLRLPRLLAWGITFLFVNFAWVFFRAKTLPDSIRMLRSMVNIETAKFSEPFANAANYFLQPFFISIKSGTLEHVLPLSTLLFLLVFFPMCLFSPNTNELGKMRSEQMPGLSMCLWIALLAGIPIFQMLFMTSRISTFIYFNF